MPLRERIEELAPEPRPFSEQIVHFFRIQRGAQWREIRAPRSRFRSMVSELMGEAGHPAWLSHGRLVDMSAGGSLRFFDKDTYPIQPLTTANEVRIVPGGSSIRDGCYIARGVVCMPPMYVNAGAYVDEGTMIDSHALVGSCAQIGKRVHLSAAAQIGGVLEPVGAVPVIIEDDVLIGGGCGVYEGTIVRERAVLAAGTILTGSTPVYDLVRETIYQRKAEAPLEIPAGAVVVPGSRAVHSERGREWGLSIYAAVIVKYRDEKTDRAVQLEDYLR